MENNEGNQHNTGPSRLNGYDGNHAEQKNTHILVYNNPHKISRETPTPLLLNGDVEKNDAITGDKFMLIYDEMNKNSNNNVTNEMKIQEAQSTSSIHHQVGFMKMIEDGNKFSWEKNDLVPQDKFKQASYLSHLKDVKVSVP